MLITIPLTLVTLLLSILSHTKASSNSTLTLTTTLLSRSVIADSCAGNDRRLVDSAIQTVGLIARRAGTLVNRATNENPGEAQRFYQFFGVPNTRTNRLKVSLRFYRLFQETIEQANNVRIECRNCRGRRRLLDLIATTEQRDVIRLVGSRMLFPLPALPVAEVFSRC